MTESPVQKHETTKLHSLHYMKFLVACHWPLILTPTNAQIELMNVISKEQKIMDPQILLSRNSDPWGHFQCCCNKQTTGRNSNKQFCV